MTTLPLGIDIGRDRVRVALVARERGEPKLLAVAARATADDPSAAIAAALLDLGTRERRCVLALNAADSHLRLVAFPPMRAGERRRAARFEAARCAGKALGDSVVRLTALQRGRWSLAVGDARAVAERLKVAKRARLRITAIDDPALALQRAYPREQAVVDIGCTSTRIVVAGDDLPRTITIPLGGEHLTNAIIAALGISVHEAEQRKRTIGLAGAGEHARDALVDAIAAALIEVRAGAAREIRSLTLTGNASRVAQLPAALERATGLDVRLGAPAWPSSLAADVLRAAAPDWSIAYGLALWACGA